MRVAATYRKPAGWRGDSHGHYLARKGIRTKVEMSGPLFYAQKREEQVPFMDIMHMVREGKDCHQIVKDHPDADPEDLRRRGIKAIESREGMNTLSVLDKNGVDESVHMAKADAAFKEKAQAVLGNHQKSSFLHPAKADSLRKRMAEIDHAR